MSTLELLEYAKELWSNSTHDQDAAHLNDLYAVIIQAGKIGLLEEAIDNYVEPHWDHWN